MTPSPAEDPAAALTRLLRDSRPEVALRVRLAQFIDGFLPPKTFYHHLTRLRGQLGSRRASEEEAWAMARLDELLEELAELLAAGVRRYDSPAVAALRSGCKPVFSALGGLGEAQELYSRYWEYRYEKRHGTG